MAVIIGGNVVVGGTGASSLTLGDLGDVNLVAPVDGNFLTYNGTTLTWENQDLPDSGVVASTYGSATEIPVITVDSKGRITAVVTQPSDTTILDTKVTGVATSTDNALARFDGTTGKLVQNSSITVGDAGELAGVASINGGQLAGFRNKIINGDMVIAQRGTSFPAVSGGTYTLDRYIWENGTSAVTTVSQTADAPSNNEFQHSLRATITTADASIAAADFAGVTQTVEGYNVRDLIGKTFTLSFWVRSSKTGVHCVAFRNSTFDRAYVTEYTVVTTDTWEYKTVTVLGGLITAGTWNWTNGAGLRIAFTMASGTNFQGTANSWLSSSAVATSNQVNCLDTVGNIFAITGVQLEVGSVATPFEHRPIGTEIVLCRRYYQKISALSMRAAVVMGESLLVSSLIPVQMRANPTATFNAGLGTGHAFAAFFDYMTLAAFPDSTGNLSISDIKLSAEL